MKQLTEQQITDNWNDLRTIINNTFEGERLEKLNKMYDYFEDRMVVAPASGRAHFHNAMVGGYVEHILHIVKFSQEIRDMWEKNGATINFGGKDNEVSERSVGGKPHKERTTNEKKSSKNKK